MQKREPSASVPNLPRRPRLPARRATAPPPLSVIVSPREQCSDEVCDEPRPAPAEISSAQPTRFPDWAHGRDVQAPVAPALGNHGHPTCGRFACPTSCQFHPRNGFHKPSSARVSRGKIPTCVRDDMMGNTFVSKDLSRETLSYACLPQIIVLLSEYSATSPYDLLSKKRRQMDRQQERQGCRYGSDAQHADAQD